jgi:hypothetical protein
MRMVARGVGGAKVGGSDGASADTVATDVADARVDPAAQPDSHSVAKSEVTSHPFRTNEVSGPSGG